MHQTESRSLWTIPWRLTDVILALLALALVWTATTLAAALLLGDGEAIALKFLLIGVVAESSLLVVAWWFGPHRRGVSLRSLGFRTPVGPSGYLLPVAVILGSLMFTAIYVSVVRALELGVLEPPPGREVLRSAEGLLVPNFLLVVFWGPLSEEAFFRGFLIPPLASRFGFLWAAGISAAFFGLIHGVVSIMVPAFFTGLLLAWLYCRTRSLWSCALAHGGQNAIAFALSV